MASIYVPRAAEGFELCHPLSQEDFETIHVAINGRPRGQSWHPIAVRVVREDQGKPLLQSDSPWLGSHALIFNSKARDRIAAELSKYGELLPLACVEEELVVFNPTRVLDALDERASSLQRFTNGRIMRVERYVFLASMVEGEDVFKIPNLRVSPTFLSHRIVELWQRAALKGLEFVKVWEG